MADVVNVAKPLTVSGQVQDLNGTALPKSIYFRCAVLNPSTTVCRVVLFDNNTNSGRIVADLTAAANDKSVPSPDYRIELSTGLYAQITGSPLSVMIFYE
jgi:hypothetical protein